MALMLKKLYICTLFRPYAPFVVVVSTDLLLLHRSF